MVHPSDYLRPRSGRWGVKGDSLTCRRVRTHLKFAHRDPSENPRLPCEKTFVPRVVARPGRLRIYATPLPEATGSRIRTRVSGDRAAVTPHGQTHPLSHQLGTIALPCELYRHLRRHLRHSRPHGHEPKTQPHHVFGLSRPAHPRTLRSAAPPSATIARAGDRPPPANTTFRQPSLCLLPMYLSPF